jgi:hypothetical protein
MKLGGCIVDRLLRHVGEKRLSEMLDQRRNVAAQLPNYESGGQEFESLRARQLNNQKNGFLRLRGITPD